MREECPDFGVCEGILLFSELKKHLQTGTYHPAYLVTGEDAFLVSSALKFFRALADPVPDFNLGELVSPESAVVVRESCECLPVGGNTRVVIVSNCKADMAPLGAYLDNPCPSTVLVFAAEKPENNLSKILSRLTIVDCAKLDKRTLLSWIALHTKEQGARITESAAALFIEYCASDMSRISAELGKLCAYRSGGIIEEEDVTALVAPTLDFKIFALSEAVATKQAPKAAAVLKNLTDGGVPSVTLLGMLYAHFRRLLYVAITPPYERMAADLGVKEYAVKKAKEQAGRFTPVKLKKICDSLQAADYDVKSGKLSDKSALELVVLRALAA